MRQRSLNVTELFTMKTSLNYFRLFYISIDEIIRSSHLFSAKFVCRMTSQPTSQAKCVRKNKWIIKIRMKRLPISHTIFMCSAIGSSELDCAHCTATEHWRLITTNGVHSACRGTDTTAVCTFSHGNDRPPIKEAWQGNGEPLEIWKLRNSS